MFGALSYRRWLGKARFTITGVVRNRVIVTEWEETRRVLALELRSRMLRGKIIRRIARSFFMLPR